MFRRINILALLIGLCVIKADQRSQLNPTVFNIGGVLSNNNSEYYFKETIAVSICIYLHISKFKSIFY